MHKGVDLHEGPNLHVCNANESLVLQMLILMCGHEEQEPQQGRACNATTGIIVRRAFWFWFWFFVE